MRKLLAVVILGSALIAGASAAFAQDDMNPAPAPNQPALGGTYVVDNQETPFAPNQQAQ